MKILVITGPPYSGKGTQCELLSKEYGYKHISLGDLCREEKTRDTEAARIIDKQEETGSLVPNYIIKKLFTDALNDNKDKGGVIIDGYPRTNEQVNDLYSILSENNLTIDHIFNIDVKESILLERAKERAKTSDRKDDKDPNIHINRLKIYNDITKPCVDYMRTKQDVVDFNGEDLIYNVYNKIKHVLGYATEKERI